MNMMQEAKKQEQEWQARIKEQDKLAVSKRAADVENKRRINQDILADLMNIGWTKLASKLLIAALAKGKIRHIKIMY